MIRHFAYALLALAAALPAAMAQEVTVVSTRVIYPGETIARDALAEVNLNRAGRDLAPLVMTIPQIEGKVATRTLLPGRLIFQSAIREAWLVQAGKPIQISLVNGALSITMTAVPLANGAAGDVVRLRNVDSGAVFTGTVLADGTVAVGAS